jgi:2-furoyl-CoA dehydrogenase FAD binding subunit
MKPVAFDYARPDTTDEALELLAEHGSDAVLLAGGMTLGPMLNLRLVKPAVVVDIGRVAELGTIEALDGQISTGAAVVQRDALDSALLADAVPLLGRALPWVGHVQTRNRGTLGGSVAHADPSAEIPLSLVTLNGRVALRSRRRKRTVPAREFFLGMLTTARLPEEMVVALEWPRRLPGEGFAFEEIAQRHGDFAIAAVACRVRVDDGRLADIALGLGGVEDRPVVVELAELIGQPVDQALDEIAAGLVAERVDPLADHAASAAQRRALAQALTRRAMTKALREASGGGE